MRDLNRLVPSMPLSSRILIGSTFDSGANTLMLVNRDVVILTCFQDSAKSPWQPGSNRGLCISSQEDDCPVIIMGLITGLMTMILWLCPITPVVRPADLLTLQPF